MRKWTLCLLFCSVPSLAQSGDETATPIAASSSVSTTSPSVSSSPPKSSLPLTYSESQCPFRTINYITHTLPQQCLRTSWPTSGQTPSVEGSGAEPTPEAAMPGLGEGRVRSGVEETPEGVRREQRVMMEEIVSTGPTIASGTPITQSDAELETDSPLDNANFLSFEEWKMKNLERVGQSPENVGQGRASSSDQRARRQPVNVNALDSLGDEAEIDIDFSGFGNTHQGESGPSSIASENQDPSGTPATTDEEGKAAPSSWALSKDAGKTCKERFNYASFDCAATVLKTNPKAKSTSSILVENKDSYMLNECSAESKYIIVELCDDILVDTVVLANYEFFSSMFRHFRISVSDRYPVKMDRWRVLGTFEARNSRDIQPFLVTEPQIWARYIRIEFLTHYGNEFYCPMSLLRVHGTTMMEQFRREEEQARGDDDFAEPIEAAAGDPVQSAVHPTSVGGTVAADLAPVPPEKEPSPAEVLPQDDKAHSSDHVVLSSTPSEQAHVKTTDATASDSAEPHGKPATISEPLADSPPSPNSSKSDKVQDADDASSSVKGAASSKNPDQASSSTRNSSSIEGTNGSAPVSMRGKDARPSANETASVIPSPSSGRAAANGTGNGTQTQSQPRSSAQTQPSPASPTTQESFFKSIHKRLQYLEANSTLSLQYIEEQSRILRDAFIKVEKKQLQKTEKFLDHLNSTVMQELKSYRNMYDQLWQSTILELEGMKERQKNEMGEIGARLSMMADELVWQKRMAVVQSTLLMLCLGLVLFVRSGSLGSQLGNTYSNLFDSPPHAVGNSGGLRRRRTFKDMWRSDTSLALSDRSGHMSDGCHAISDLEIDSQRSPVQVAFSPPTPITPGTTPTIEKELDFSPEQPNGTTTKEQNIGLATPPQDPISDHHRRIQVLETQSSPATPRGSRDSRPSWEEVDRAIDLLKAEENGEEKQREYDMKREKRKRRSPLRRAESYDDAVSDSPDDDGAEGLFVVG